MSKPTATIVPTILADPNGELAMQAILDAAEALTETHPFSDAGMEAREHLHALVWNVGFSPVIPDRAAWAWVVEQGVAMRQTPAWGDGEAEA